MDFLKLKALEYGMALVIGPLAAVIVQGAKRYIGWVDQLPAWQKRAFVLVTATALTALGAVTGVEFAVTGEDISLLNNLDAEAVKAALAAAVAFLLHAVKKRRELKP